MTKTITTSKDGKNTITFNYKKIGGSTTTPTAPAEKVTVTINYILRSTTTNIRSTTTNNGKILKTETKQVDLNSIYTVDAPEIDGYTVVPEENHTDTKVTQDNLELNVPYTKDATTPVTPVDPADTTTNVTVKYVDDKGKDVAPAKILTDQKVGETVSADAIDVPNYDLTSTKTATTKVAEDGSSVIEFTYKAKKTTPVTPEITKANVTVKVVDDKGNSLGKDTTVADQEVGKDATITAPTIEGYTADPATQTVNVAKGGSTVKFTYTKNVEAPKTATITTKFVADGKEIADAKTDTVEVGKDFSAKSVAVDGYTLDGDATQVIDSVTGDATLIFNYTKNVVASKTADIIINYKDADGNVIKTATTDTADIDSTYTAKDTDVEGYTLDASSNQPITVKADGNVINLSYTKNTEPVKEAIITTTYVDSEGNTIKNSTTETAKIGNKYSIEYPTISGYLPTGDTIKTIDSVTGDTTLTFTYTDKVPLSVQMISADTGYAVGNAIQTKRKIGEKVTVNVPDVLGYDVIGATPQEVTISSKGGIYADNIVTFKYKRNEEKMKNVISQLNAELFKLENKFRAENNVPALTLDSNLQAGAEARAQQQVYGLDTLGHYIGHEQPDGTDFSAEPHLKAYSDENGGLGENIGFGGTYDSDISKWALKIFNLQIGDQEHYDNALNSNYKAGGFAVGISSDGTTFGVQDFGEDSSK